MQTKFLDVLFSDECRGNVRKAMAAAGYTAGTPLHAVVGPLTDEIHERTEAHLAALSEAAALNMGGIVNDPDALVSKTHFDALRDLLDRTGHAKKEKLEVSAGSGGGLFVLPPKAKIEDE